MNTQIPKTPNNAAPQTDTPRAEHVVRSRRLMSLNLAPLLGAAACMGVMLASNHASAINWCSIQVVDEAGNILHEETAGRGDDFGDRTVRQLYDCDACWSGGKDIGPSECGASGDEYEVSCQKNNGTVLTKTYSCP